MGLGGKDWTEVFKFTLLKTKVPEYWLRQTLFTGGHALASSLQSPPGTQSSFTIHSQCPFMHPRSTAGRSQRREEPVPSRRAPAAAGQRNLQVRRPGGPSRACLARAVRARRSCTSMPCRTSFPKRILPEAHLRVLLTRPCTLVQSGRGTPGGEGGIRAPSSGMHGHPRACSCPDRTPGARSRALTERGSLAGPGPKLTTCVGASMVQRRGTQHSGRGLIARSVRVCGRRRPSAFCQHLAGVPIGPSCRRPGADWFARQGAHPHWSCLLAGPGISCSSSRLLFQPPLRSAQGTREIAPASGLACAPVRASWAAGRGCPCVRASAPWMRPVPDLQP